MLLICCLSFFRNRRACLELFDPLNFGRMLRLERARANLIQPSLTEISDRTTEYYVRDQALARAKARWLAGKSTCVQI